ncbi:hypothetical protein [Escherichia coli]
MLSIYIIYKPIVSNNT